MSDYKPHKTDSRIVAFLYLLMRDHLPTGVVAEVTKELEATPGTNVLTNGWLAKYAEHIARALSVTGAEERCWCGALCALHVSVGPECVPPDEPHDDDSKELLALVTAASDWADSMGDSVAGDESSLSREELVLHAAVTEWRAKVKAIGTMGYMPPEQARDASIEDAVPVARGGTVVLGGPHPQSIECTVERVDVERQTVVVRQYGFMLFEVPIQIVEKELCAVGARVRLVFHNGGLTAVERA